VPQPEEEGESWVDVVVHGPEGVNPPYSPFVFTREGLIERIRKILENRDASLQLAPFPHGIWPAFIPGFNGDHQHTPQELESIDAALKIIESNWRIPFIDIPEPTVEQVATVERAFPGTREVAKVPDLPPATMSEVRSEAIALLEDHGIPITPAMVARKALDEAGFTEPQMRQIVVLAKGDPDANVTELLAERIIAIIETLKANVVVYPAADLSTLAVDPADISKKLIAKFGGRREVLLAANGVCKVHGLTTMKSAKAVFADPLLSALLLYLPYLWEPTS
jgi:hypothetical protein